MDTFIGIIVLFCAIASIGLLLTWNLLRIARIAKSGAKNLPEVIKELRSE